MSHRRSVRFHRWLRTAAAVLLLGAPSPLWAAYTMKIVPTYPKGSAGEKPPATLPTNTEISPCSSTTLVDSVIFTLTYDASNASTKKPDRDVYVIIHNAGGDPRFYSVQKKGPSVAPTMTPRTDVTALTAARATDIYLRIADNPGTAVTETLFGGFISLDGLPNGTWQLVGIVADSTEVDFDDPATWNAWDVATVMLAKPWGGKTASVCK